jgi:SAM-dependent methyltransferase
MPPSTIPDRVAWAVNQLDLRPDDRVLEIGGGPGAAAELVCSRLEQGFLLGVDRSSVAIERSARRNQHFLDSGRLELRLGRLADLEVPAGSFDLAFCVDVNLFWTGAAQPELDRLHQALRPGGRLHVCYGPTPARPRRGPGDGAASRRGFAVRAGRSAPDRPRLEVRATKPG